MIYITIRVNNDHASYSEQFESLTLLLDPDDEHLKSMIEQTLKNFNQEAQEVIIKTKMEV
jgi:hypothetical protein